MKVLGKNILVEETLTKKFKSNIILPGEDNKDKEELMYHLTSRVVKEVGEDVLTKILPEDKPILTSWAEPIYSKITQGKEGDAIITRLSVYQSDVFVAIDND